MKQNAEPGVVLRGDVSEFFGQMYDGDREVWDILGYDEEVTASMYRSRYRRDDIARRIITKPAEDSWKYEPKIRDTDEESEFQQAVDILAQQKRIWQYCKRADISAGIGEYGLLFIGFADGQALSEPVNEGVLSGPEDIAYMSPFSQDVVEEWTLGKETDDIDETDPMYNQPVEYEIDFSDIDGDPDEEDMKRVHHTRIVHIAEGLVESELKGTPRLRSIWNRLLDREKVVGASAEMFWTGADRKFHFNIDSDNASDLSEDQLSALDDEVQKLVHDMQHYIKTFNTDMEVLSGEEIDPSGVYDVLMKSISGATGIPKRILEGSERGELASTQDRANWYGKVQTRQQTYIEYQIVRPLIDMFTQYGILPEPQDGTYTVEWDNLFELNDLEEATAMKERATALNNMSPAGNTDVVASMGQLVDFVLHGDDIDTEAEGDELPPVDETQANIQWDDMLEQ